MISFEQMRAYPEDPSLRVLLDLDPEYAGVVEPHDGGLSLQERIDELREHLVPAGMIEDFSQMAHTLDVAEILVLKCAVTFGEELGCYASEENTPGMSAVADQFVVISAKLGPTGPSLSPTDILLHEVTHMHLADHDWRFATFLNWARLRCGLPLLTDVYDVKDETALQWNGRRLAASGVLKFCHALAQNLARGDWEPREVARALKCVSATDPTEMEKCLLQELTAIWYPSEERGRAISRGP